MALLCTTQHEGDWISEKWTTWPANRENRREHKRRAGTQFIATKAGEFGIRPFDTVWKLQYHHKINRSCVLCEDFEQRRDTCI